jgi:hypothetical protein
MSSYNNYDPRGQSNAYDTPDSMYGEPDLPDQCLHCSQTFPSGDSLFKHMREVHPEVDGPLVTSNDEPRSTAAPSAYYQEAAAVCQLNPL